MDSASRMRIICDPYRKEINYEWYNINIEDYEGFDPEYSEFAREDLVNATIQNRADEIIQEINDECNLGNVGLEIEFVGTTDDYSDFCDVIDRYYSKSNIRCIRANHYFNTASIVLPQIKERFSCIKEMLEEYSEDEITKLVNKYSDAIKPSISLCIMGLYSSGKSAFINSIIGAEVLPSASSPTTAKVCKICCSDDYQIRFLFDDKECILTFSGSSYKPSQNGELEIIKDLQSIVSSNDLHDEVYHMNHAIEILNGYSNNEHRISDIIEVRVPFHQPKLPIMDYDFVIYDTPGSNSVTNSRHIKVLKDSLDDQTNALPIFLTTPDLMDANDNDKLLEIIEETGTALDTTNAIVIVNKADEKGPKTLREIRAKCQNLRITKWKSTRIFFLSSLIAVASKKNNPEDEKEWLDEDMYELFEEKKQKFVSDERRLCDFNIIDRSKVDESNNYNDQKQTTHLYKNSGLEAIEKEIIEYARKYALYNKCFQASIYLQEAIDLCVENVAEVEERLNSALENAKEHFDFKKRELCEKLEKRKQRVSFYNSVFQRLMEDAYNTFVTNNDLIYNDSNARKQLQKRLHSHWKEYKETEKRNQKDKTWALSQIQIYSEQLYNEYINSFSSKANSIIVSFWDEKSAEFKEDCQKIVHDSDALTEEQKEILESIVLSKNNMSTIRLDFDLRQLGAIRKKRFLFWVRKEETFNAKDCSTKLTEQFNNEVRTRTSSAEKENEKSFDKWTNSLISTLIEELCKFNADLSTYKMKIEEINADIESKKECEKLLVDNKRDIDHLLNIQEGTNYE